MWAQPLLFSSAAGSIGYCWQLLSYLAMNFKGSARPHLIAFSLPAPPFSELCAVLRNEYPVNNWFIHFLIIFYFSKMLP